LPAAANDKTHTPNFTILTNIPAGSNQFPLTDQGNQPILLVFWPIFWYYLLCRHKNYGGTFISLLAAG
jgi:hypothetical protein